ncbi:MAG: lipocalin-like domain-containing protein [Acidobacteriota bacterium]|nr:lipocalin-like domain-containing protein [Acidobacteriota bacterium]
MFTSHLIRLVAGVTGLTVGLFVVTGCSNGQETAQGSSSDASGVVPVGARVEGVVGAWELVSVEQRDATGDLLPPPEAPAFGAAGAMGLLVCDATGHLGLAIMQEGRPSYEDPTPEEALVDLEGYTGIFGTYTVNETEGALNVHVQGSRDPRLTGTEQVWLATREGDRLTLELSVNESGTRPTLEWDRVPEMAELTPIHQRVIGFWEHVPNDGAGADEPPLRAGFIIYTAAGRMMVHLMSPTRDTYSSDGPTPDEAQSAVSTYTSYFGPYSLDEAGRYLVHHRVAHTLNLADRPPAERRTGVGTDAQRFYELVDDTMVLRFLSTAGVVAAPASGDATEWGGMITWRRLGPVREN